MNKLAQYKRKLYTIKKQIQQLFRRVYVSSLNIYRREDISGFEAEK